MAQLITITDANAHLFVNPDPNVHGRGHIPRDWARVPHGALPYGAVNSLPARLTRDEIKRRAMELKASGRNLTARRRKAGLRSQDQNGTNYCWANGPTSCYRMRRLLQGQSNIEISAASVAAVIKGGLNQGGWGGDALEFYVNRGAVPASMWPENDRNYRKYATPEIEKERESHRVTEWWDLPDRDFLMLCTLLVYEVPVAIGLNWWSHEVTAMDVVVLNSQQVNDGYAAAKTIYEKWPKELKEKELERSASDLGVRIWNSWSDDWSDQGEGDLSESKATPDGAVAPAVITPST